jgi:hypothetical protein
MRLDKAERSGVVYSDRSPNSVRAMRRENRLAVIIENTAVEQVKIDAFTVSCRTAHNLCANGGVVRLVSA